MKVRDSASGENRSLKNKSEHNVGHVEACLVWYCSCFCFTICLSVFCLSLKSTFFNLLFLFTFPSKELEESLLVREWCVVRSHSKVEKELFFKFPSLYSSADYAFSVIIEVEVIILAYICFLTLFVMLVARCKYSYWIIKRTIMTQTADDISFFLACAGLYLMQIKFLSKGSRLSPLCHHVLCVEWLCLKHRPTHPHFLRIDWEFLQMSAPTTSKLQQCIARVTTLIDQM